MQGLWVITIISSCLGALFILMGFSQGTAPAQAASFACAVAFAVIPYVFTRAAQELGENKAVKELKRIADMLERGKESPGS